MTYRSTKVFFGALVAALLATPCLAEIYKYQDDDGNWVFSEKPPKDDSVQVETVVPKHAPASSSAIDKLEADKARAQKMTEERHARAEAEAKSMAEAKERKQECEKARENLRNLEASTRLQYVNENNERAFVTEEMRQKRMSKAREHISKLCS